MHIDYIPIDSLDHPGARMFAECDRLLAAKGLFVAESPLVVSRAIEGGCEPVAFLAEEGLELPSSIHDLIAGSSHGHAIPVYVGAEQLLRQIRGHALIRGIQAAFRIPEVSSAESACRHARRVVVLDNVVDAVNVGTIFRSAAALGMDAVLLTPTACSPLNRRASRASMGSVFKIPWAWIESPSLLQSLGFKTAAMALTDASVPPDDPALMSEPRLAIVMGNEGNGLPKETIASCDYTVCIPMKAGVDSLNVATAAAIAFWQLRGVNE